MTSEQRHDAEYVSTDLDHQMPYLVAQHLRGGVNDGC
jgi:hypothetical protein